MQKRLEKILESILFMIILLCFIGCSKSKKDEQVIPEPPEAVSEYKIATYNIRVITNNDAPNNLWASRLPLVADVIKKYDFDIYGTQEGHGVQIDDLLEALPQYDYVGVSDINEHTKQHQAIFYKRDMFEKLREGNFWLAPGGPEIPPPATEKQWDAAYAATVVSWAKFKDKSSGYTFYVFNGHFDPTGTTAKVESANLVLTKIPQIAGTSPIMLMGDLNTDQTSDAYNILNTSNLFKDAYELADKKFSTSATFNNWVVKPIGDLRIDHIFLTSDFHVNSHNVLTDQYNGRLPSDHFPVLIKIQKPKL